MSFNLTLPPLATHNSAAGLMGCCITSAATGSVSDEKCPAPVPGRVPSDPLDRCIARKFDLESGECVMTNKCPNKAVTLKFEGHDMQTGLREEYTVPLMPGAAHTGKHLATCCVTAESVSNVFKEEPGGCFEVQTGEDGPYDGKKVAACSAAASTRSSNGC